MSGGVILMQTDTKNINDMTGLARTLPFTSFAFIIGAFSVIGLPFLNGFVSKWYLYVAGISSGYVLVTLLALITTAITLGYFLKPILIFFGPTHRKPRINEIDPHVFIPIFILTFLCIAIGVYPEMVRSIIENAVHSLLNASEYLVVL